jgi:glyoxylase I family protein
MREIVAIHHVSLIVSDTRRALSFYQGLLGLAVDPERPDLGYPGAWLWVGERQIHLLEVANPDPVEGRPGHGGRDRHLALAVSDLDAVARRLEGAGVACQRSRSGREALFCRDPDANAIELIAVTTRGDSAPVAQEPQEDDLVSPRG